MYGEYEYKYSLNEEDEWEKVIVIGNKKITKSQPMEIEYFLISAGQNVRKHPRINEVCTYLLLPVL